MIPQLELLINPAYRIHPQQDGNYLILEETENEGKSNTRKLARVNIDSIKSFAVYKFDQAITIKGRHEETFGLETYAPFLTAAKGARSMCDFILFYTCDEEPEKIHAWVLNLKSTRLGNSDSQMHAGLRLTTFLVNKLEDTEKAHDARRKLGLGQVNFILFSLGRPGTPGTNPGKAKNTRQSTPLAGTHPAYPCHYQTRQAPRVGPIAAR